MRSGDDVNWKIDWKQDGIGVAQHAPTGATFYISRSGWMGVSEPASLSSAKLAELIAELRTLMGPVAAASIGMSHRVH
jgi:hypothetical protein